MKYFCIFQSVPSFESFTIIDNFISVVGLLVSLIRCETKFHHCKDGKIPDRRIDTAFLMVDKQGINSTIIVQLVTAECYKVNIQALPISKQNVECRPRPD